MRLGLGSNFVDMPRTLSQRIFPCLAAIYFTLRNLQTFTCAEAMIANTGPFLQEKRLRVTARLLADVATDNLT